MQTTVLPAGLCEDIDKIIRRFLWGYNNSNKKIHHVSWLKVCCPKSEGGLGIKPTRLVNQAFMIKLGWRIIKNPQALWVRIITAKYIQGNTQDFNKSRRSHRYGREF